MLPDLNPLFSGFASELLREEDPDLHSTLESMRIRIQILTLKKWSALGSWHEIMRTQIRSYKWLNKDPEGFNRVKKGSIYCKKLLILYLLSSSLQRLMIQFTSYSNLYKEKLICFKIFIVIKFSKKSRVFEVQENMGS